jgi:hypothetical protein
MASMAMRMSLNFLTKDKGLGSGQGTLTNEIGNDVFSQELEK